MTRSSFRNTCNLLISNALALADTVVTPKIDVNSHQKGWMALLLVSGGSVWFEGVRYRIRWSADPVSLMAVLPGCCGVDVVGGEGVGYFGRGLDTNMGWAPKILLGKRGLGRR